MEIEAIKEILSVVKDAGWMGVTIFGIWIAQKLLYVSIAGFSVYKIIGKVVNLFSGRATNLEIKIASAMGVTTPLKDSEIKTVLDKVRKK